jgi:hypothetical protein
MLLLLHLGYLIKAAETQQWFARVANSRVMELWLQPIAVG